MKRVLVITVAVAMALSTVPVAMASGYNSWYQDGNAEPNVPGWDTQADRLQQHPNQEAKDEIFFDVVVEQHDATGLPNPNTDQTNLRPQEVFHARALLGYWRDCNQDGFVGSPAFGFQYPVEHGDTSICPTSSHYNDGSQMFEYLAIGDGARDVSQDDDLCPTRDGTPEKPRSADDEGVLEGGDNILCTGERPNYVQDDFAEVWHDFGLPTDAPAETTLLFPLPDGTLRDTNGHFKYVDDLTFDTLSTSFPGLWPSSPDNAKNQDPTTPNQCQNGEGEATDATGYASNAVQGATDPTCSPVPNLRKATLPVTGAVAYPGHLVENRVNDSEATNKHPTPITEPFTHEPNEQNTEDENPHKCELKEDPDTWDDDPSDGDPFYGGDVTGDPVSFAQAYYGPQDAGPSLEGTNSNVLAGVFYTAGEARNGQASADCSKGGAIGNLEFHGEAGTGDEKKTTADTDFFFEKTTAFNPATAPGAGDGTRADSQHCVAPVNTLEEYSLRCVNGWDLGSQWFFGHGATSLDPTATASVTATFYADVTFGENTFDSANDGSFDVEQGYFEQPGGLAEAAALPAGEDDAHTYGDENCDEYTSLDTAGTDVVNEDHIIATVSGWNCDRNAWAEAAQLDCSAGNRADEVACWELPMPGDAYDFRDVECFDNDVASQGTTDTTGPLGDANELAFGDRENGATGLAIDDPGRSCQHLPAPPG